MNDIEKVFKKLNQSGKKAFIPYIMAGDPSLEATMKFVAELEEAGADIIELGVPFSDPLADGPVIQRAAERALSQGVTLKKVLTLVSAIRQSSKVPIILMTYYNPVFKYGIEVFAEDAAKAGANGVIIPDLTPDEADAYIRAARQQGVATVFLLAPTSTEGRINKAVKAATGFIYYVSITGTTGAKLLMDETMKTTLNKIRAKTSKPVAVGFGVSGPEDAKAVASTADGVIVGSAIVKLIAEGKDIKEFVKSLRDAI
ncbi:MAG: tryptophan synthase subunit alpha [Nitrospiraceae bacterium]|nr:MAG: tryptophan synthase subunit alpha [Nitrospiraceae bacterium]